MKYVGSYVIVWKELWPITVCQLLGNRLFFWGIKSQWTRRAIHIMLKGIGVLIYRKWLLFNARSAIFKLYHGENKLIFNEMMMRSALYYTNTLSWIFIVPAHWNNSPRLAVLYILILNSYYLSIRYEVMLCLFVKC